MVFYHNFWKNLPPNKDLPTPHLNREKIWNGNAWITFADVKAFNNREMTLIEYLFGTWRGLNILEAKKKI